jgi:starvation-inducible DNA-binding protein
MESERHVDIFWSSAHPWSHLGQRYWPRIVLGTSREETIPLFSIERPGEECRLLNDALADSIILLGLYNKHYWLVRSEFHSGLDQLLRQHAREQIEFIDHLADRVHELGGVAIFDPRHVADATTIPPAPNGLEESPSMLYRILEAHRIVIQKIHRVMTFTEENGGGVADQRLMSDVLSRHQHQAWLVAEHLVDTLTNA